MCKPQCLTNFDIIGVIKETHGKFYILITEYLRNEKAMRRGERTWATLIVLSGKTINLTIACSKLMDNHER
jgi:hypothetical protein